MSGMGDNIAKYCYEQLAEIANDITELQNTGVDTTARADIAKLTSYSEVTAAGDVYTIDFANFPIKRVKIETEDADAKTIAFDNAPEDAELTIELTYTNEADITWPNGVTWLSEPVFESEKVYRISLYKYGTGWHGAVVGGW